MYLVYNINRENKTFLSRALHTLLVLTLFLPTLWATSLPEKKEDEPISEKTKFTTALLKSHLEDRNLKIGDIVKLTPKKLKSDIVHTQKTLVQCEQALQLSQESYTLFFSYPNEIEEENNALIDVLLNKSSNIKSKDHKPEPHIRVVGAYIDMINLDDRESFAYWKHYTNHLIINKLKKPIKIVLCMPLSSLLGSSGDCIYYISSVLGTYLTPNIERKKLKPSFSLVILNNCMEDYKERKKVIQTVSKNLANYITFYRQDYVRALHSANFRHQYDGLQPFYRTTNRLKGAILLLHLLLKGTPKKMKGEQIKAIRNNPAPFEVPAYDAASVTTKGIFILQGLQDTEGLDKVREAIFKMPGLSPDYFLPFKKSLFFYRSKEICEGADRRTKGRKK